MSYRELIMRIHEYTGGRSIEEESQDALELVVENVAAHLDGPLRHEFAAQLPQELHNAAMMVPTANHLDENIIEQLMDLEDVDESRAKQYIHAAWQVLQDLFERSDVEDITAQLPQNVVASLR